MVSVVLLARRHLKWEKELQMDHFRFLEQNLQRILKNCQECLLEIFWKDNRNGRKDFANASDYEITWNDTDNITAVIARKQFLDNINSTYIIRCKKSALKQC